MRAYYAVVHKDPDSAFGAQFPDLPGVFSAADSEDEIVDKAIEALRLWAEDQVLPEPASLEAVRQHAEVREALAEGAFLVRVPFIEDDTRFVRVNISLESGMLRAIDVAAKQHGVNRSAFLSRAARKAIEGSA